MWRLRLKESRCFDKYHFIFGLRGDERWSLKINYPR